MLAVLALALWDCAEHEGDEEEEAAAAVRHRVDAQGRVVLSRDERELLDLATAPAEQGTLTVSALRFGRVSARPEEEALLIAPATGRLGPPAVALGSTASEGDVLLDLTVVVDTASLASLEAQRRELAGQVEAAQAQVVALTAERDRVASLVPARLATEAERARAEAELTSEQARLQSLRRAGAGLARATGGHLELRAPLSGVVVALASQPGALVSQGETVARIVRAGPRFIDLAVPPGDPRGTSYRAHGPTGEPVTARLLSEGTVVEDDGTRRDRLQVDPPGALSLPPGATIPVDVLREATGVLVPEAAVLRSGGDHIVFVEEDGGAFAPTVVEVGASASGQVVVTSGLTPPARVVVRGGGSLLAEVEEERRDSPPGAAHEPAGPERGEPAGAP